MLVNDRIDVALAAGAGGVHLPGGAVSSARVRAIVPQSFLVGRSVHSAGEAIEAALDGGCDYLVFGSVFATRSKPAGHAVAGLDALAGVCAAVQLPVLAIGGITPARVPDLVRAGAAGIAAIGLFAAGDERELRDTVRQIRRAFG
jgi:thiamine-phosphate diphosphorylase